MDVSNLLNSLRGARIIDLSQTLEEHMPHFPTHSKFFHNLWGSYWYGGRSLSYQLVMHEHNGTHVDAPAHFISEAKPDAHLTIDQVPVARLMGRGVHLDCRTCKEADYVSREQIMDWESRHGRLRRVTSCCLTLAGRRAGGFVPMISPTLSNGPGSAWEPRSTLSPSPCLQSAWIHFPLTRPKRCAPIPSTPFYWRSAC